MASFKCPDCGATLTDDSKFCKYCGAKIDDGVKRFEINVNKRIEDVAEIKRAEREERESLRREKKEKARTVAKWVRRGIIAAILLFGVLLTAYGTDSYFGGLAIIIGVFVYLVVTWLHKVL